MLTEYVFSYMLSIIFSFANCMEVQYPIKPN